MKTDNVLPNRHYSEDSKCRKFVLNHSLIYFYFMCITFRHCIISICALLVFTLGLYAGIERADSLRNVLLQTTDDSVKIGLSLKIANEIKWRLKDSTMSLCQYALKESRRLGLKHFEANAILAIGMLYQHSSELDTAIILLKDAEAIYREINYRKGEAGSRTAIGDTYYLLDENEIARDYWRKALNYYTESKDTIGLANIGISLGDINYLEDNYVQAVNYYTVAFENYQHLNSLQGMGNALNCMADVYFHEENYEKAIAKYNAAIELFVQAEDILGQANCYRQLGDIKIETKQLDEALTTFKIAIGFYDQIGSRHGLAACNRSIGDINFELGNYVIAQNKFNESLAEYRKLSNKLGIVNCHYGMSKMYVSLGEYNKAIICSDTVMSEATRLKIPDIRKEAAEIYSKAYAGLGDYEKAHKYEQLFHHLKDSINSKASIQKVTQLQMQFDFDQSQREQKLIQEKKALAFDMELERQKTYKHIFIGAIAIVLLFMGLLFKNYLIKRKSNIALSEKNIIITEKNKEITESIEYAEQIQTAIMKSNDFFSNSFSEHFILFQPRDNIGGDFYWMHETKDGKIIWTVSDCTGHGVPGALMSMVGISLLNYVVVEKKIVDPEEILSQLRNEIVKVLQQKDGTLSPKDGMDMGVCVLDKSSLKLSFSGSYNPMYIVRNQELIEKRGARFTVGLSRKMEKRFGKEELQLIKGDKIYLLTDGYADQFGGESGKKYKYKALKETLLGLKNVSLKEQGEILENNFETWRVGYAQIDDVCIVGVLI